MDNTILLASLRATVRIVPDVLPFLSMRTRRALAEPTAYKTYEFFLRAVEGLVHGVYNGLVDSDFVYAMDNLITGQLRDAYVRAWADDGNFGDLPDYLQASLDAMVEEQQSHVVDFFRAIIDARVDGTPIAPLLNRAGMWAHQWGVAYREASRLILLENGGRLVWRKGETERGCRTCDQLDGIIMYAKEWQTLDVHPRGYPNPKLECQGGGPVNNCDCDLLPTDKRRSPKGFETVMNIIELATGKHYGPGVHPGTGTEQDVHGGDAIISKAESVAKERGVTVSKIEVVDLPNKWGEYNPKSKVIRFSRDVLDLSERLQDYVILHEITHIDYPNHGSLFQMVMAALMPDWQQREAELPKRKE